MLKRLALRDFVIVTSLEVEFTGGFAVLTGETGAGKSILIDALQLALGGRGDASAVREGAARAEISAEFEPLGPALLAWLDEAGFGIEEPLLLRRTVDAQGKSRAWINGSAATVAQLRELGERLVDIHGQHAWQSLTRPAAVRALLDGYAGIDPAPLATAWSAWRHALAALEAARSRGEEVERERERLTWQIGELDRLAPGTDEWATLNAEHQRLAHGQAILDAVQAALELTREAEDSASALTARAVDALAEVAAYDSTLASALEVLRDAQAQLDDAAHSLQAALRHTELEPERLAELDARLSAWLGLARRFRRSPEELPATRQAWRAELQALEAAADLEGLQRQADAARQRFLAEAAQVSAARRAAAPAWSAAITQAMQALGMAGGRFEIALPALETPQAHGLESVEFLVAGHAGSTPRPLAKVASGGELSRIALAVAVTACERRHAQGGSAATLIFDEVDAGVGGTVADTVGRLMRRLGQERQVLAVTHLAQVAACADQHLVVSKEAGAQGRTTSQLQPVEGEARVAELARMLGGGAHSPSGLAHAREMLASVENQVGAAAPVPSAPDRATHACSPPPAAPSGAPAPRPRRPSS
ncbi:MAG: DNA repair protein RecN [Burkholderiaceae bacterium]|nr:DNA repair protein RecN [Burkholderiaceae bacterium]